MAKQKDGRYRAKITVGTDASGKSIVKYVSGRTKKYAKPIDNYSGIVYNKDIIKQGAKAPKGVKNEKHGKRKR